MTLVRDILFHPFRRRYSGEELWALRQVTFCIEKGRALGVIGENGAGKTTLLMALAGIYAPDEGTISVKGRAASLLEVGAGFRWDLTGRENVYLYGAIMGIPRREIQKSFNEIVEFAGMEAFIDAPLRTYSAGMRMRLGFSVAMSVQPDLLLVDEALSVGDSAFQRRAMERIQAFRKQGGTLIYVSHDMNQVGNLCDECLLIEKGCAVQFGNTLDVIATYWERIWGREVQQVALGKDGTEPKWLQGARRWGSGEMWIAEITIANHRGQPTNTIEHGQRFSMAFHFNRGKDKSIDPPVFQVGFFQGKRNVAVYRSDPASFPKELAQNGGTASLVVDSTPLPIGAYSIGVEIRNETFTRMYDCLDKCISISLVRPEGPGPSPELLHLPCQWVFSQGDN